MTTAICGGSGDRRQGELAEASRGTGTPLLFSNYSYVLKRNPSYRPYPALGGLDSYVALQPIMGGCTGWNNQLYPDYFAGPCCSRNNLTILGD